VIDPIGASRSATITAMLVAMAAGPGGRPGITRNLSEEAGQASWDSETALQRERLARQAVYASSSLADTGTQFRAAVGRPSEMRGAVICALAVIGQKIDAALPMVKIPESWAHLGDLRREVGRGTERPPRRAFRHRRVAHASRHHINEPASPRL
jgi:hypothetical protein